MTTTAVGDIYDRSESYLEWKIPNWKSWMSRPYALVSSPSFQFSNATWMLKMMYVHGQLQLDVVRITWEEDNQVVEFKLSARRSSVTEHTIFEGKFQFKKDYNRHESSLSEHLAQKLERCGILTIACVFYKYRNMDNSATESISSKCIDTLMENKGEDSGKNEDIKSEDGRGNQEDIETLTADFKDLFLNGKGSDVTLTVQGREFRVHKAILRARSSVFDSMFTHDMKENISGIVSISDCAPEAFADLLQYMYCGNVDKFSTDNIYDLYQAADKYDVIKLKKKMCPFHKE